MLDDSSAPRILPGKRGVLSRTAADGDGRVLQLYAAASAVDAYMKMPIGEASAPEGLQDWCMTKDSGWWRTKDRAGTLHQVRKHEASPAGVWAMQAPEMAMASRRSQFHSFTVWPQDDTGPP